MMKNVGTVYINVIMRIAILMIHVIIAKIIRIIKKKKLTMNLRFLFKGDSKMTELQKQLSFYKRKDKDLKYLINYLFTIYDDEEKIIDELIPLGYPESEIVEMLEYDFALDMSWNKFSVNYNHGITV